MYIHPKFKHLVEQKNHQKHFEKSASKQPVELVAHLLDLFLVVIFEVDFELSQRLTFAISRNFHGLKMISLRNFPIILIKTLLQNLSAFRSDRETGAGSCNKNIFRKSCKYSTTLYLVVFSPAIVWCR